MVERGGREGRIVGIVLLLLKSVVSSPPFVDTHRVPHARTQLYLKLAIKDKAFSKA